MQSLPVDQSFACRHRVGLFVSLLRLSRLFFLRSLACFLFIIVETVFYLSETPGHEKLCPSIATSRKTRIVWSLSNSSNSTADDQHHFNATIGMLNLKSFTCENVFGLFVLITISVLTAERHRQKLFIFPRSHMGPSPKSYENEKNTK